MLTWDGRLPDPGFNGNNTSAPAASPPSTLPSIRILLEVFLLILSFYNYLSFQRHGKGRARRWMF